MLSKTITRLLIVLSSSVLVWGQASSTLNGSVNDPSGAHIPGAAITLTEVETGLTRTTVSNTDGLYVLSSLRPTSYTLKVEAGGFKSLTQTGIKLLANDTATINLSMEIGSASEAITVTASGNQIDTTSATLREVIDSTRVVELPLNGRNAAQLTTLVAGAVLGPSNSADLGITRTFPSAVTISVNGTRTNQTSFMLDGVPNNDLMTTVNMPFPMPDALQEFSVQTSNFSAEYGQNAGGVVNIVTRSGSNTFHGDAFGYLRNAVFNARNFFAASRDPLKRGQYGGTVGGPIIRDKAFFFFGYQGTRLRSVTGGLKAFVPTQANLVGDFSALLSATNPNNPLGRAIAIKDSTTGVTLPNNQIPMSELDPAALTLGGNWLPKSTGSGLVFYATPLAQNLEEYTARVDYNLSNSDRITFRYFRDGFTQPATLVNSNLLTGAFFGAIAATNIVFQETHIFNANLLNEFRFGVVPESDMRGPPPGTPSLSALGINGVSPPSAPTIQNITVTGYFTLGQNQGKGEFPRISYTFSDAVRYQLGRHSFAFGGQFQRSSLDENTETGKPGAFSFSGDTTGNAMADFITGKLRTFTQGNGTIESNRRNLFDLFAHDTFKVSSRLTLNYGLRWEPSLPWHDKYETADVFIPALYAQGVTSRVYTNAPPGEMFPGDPGIPDDARYGQWNIFAPRIGFAYDLFGHGKTSLRGGVGAFYDAAVPGWGTNHISQAQPFTLAITLTSPKGPFSNPYLGVANPFPAALPNPKNVVFPAPVTADSLDPGLHLKAAADYNGNLTIEHQIAPNWLVRAAYVGSHTNHINVNQMANPSVYTPGRTTDGPRIYNGYGIIEYGGVPAGNAWYNSLQLTLQKRLSKGFTILANYTWSKALDNVPINLDATAMTGNGWYALPVTLPDYERLDRGPSDFNRSQVATISYVWQIPSPTHASPWMRGVAGGWQVSGIITAESGLPVTITAGLDRSLTTVAEDRADVVTGQKLYTSGPCANVAPCLNYFNPQAFALPALGTFGNAGKGLITGPRFFDWDMSVAKSFPVREHINVQLRGEFFNTLNRANFLMSTTTGPAPIISFSGAGFGSILSAADPRIIQMALKINF